MVLSFCPLPGVQSGLSLATPLVGSPNWCYQLVWKATGTLLLTLVCTAQATLPSSPLGGWLVTQHGTAARPRVPTRALIPQSSVCQLAAGVQNAQKNALLASGATWLVGAAILAHNACNSKSGQDKDFVYGAAAGGHGLRVEHPTTAPRYGLLELRPAGLPLLSEGTSFLFTLATALQWHRHWLPQATPPWARCACGGAAPRRGNGRRSCGEGRL